MAQDRDPIPIPGKRIRRNRLPKAGRRRQRTERTGTADVPAAVVPMTTFSDEGTNDQLLSPKEFHQTLKGLPADQIRIPQQNKGSVDPLIQEKLERLKYTKEAQGMDMKYEIQKRKDFRNPSIYEKLIDHCHIREFGSNFPTDIFDPDAFESGSYYEELSKAQKVLMDSITEKEKDSHPKVEIIHAVAKKSSVAASASSSSSSDPSRKKRSKWDEGPAAKKFV